MQIEELVSAVRHQLSKEDRRLLRTLYEPALETAYDELFDRVVERLKPQLASAIADRHTA
jgi:cation transport regulator ChaB